MAWFSSKGGRTTCSFPGENISPEEIETNLGQTSRHRRGNLRWYSRSEMGGTGRARGFHAGGSATEEELKAFCRDYLADYKVPKQVRSVTELPLTGAGKLNRNAVVTHYAGGG